MNKVKLKLNRTDWQWLAGFVLAWKWELSECGREHHAIYTGLQKAVYVKLHNKLHSLNERRNQLNLSFAEAALLSLLLQFSGTMDYRATDIITTIDQKLV